MHPTKKKRILLFSCQKLASAGPRLGSGRPLFLGPAAAPGGSREGRAWGLGLTYAAMLLLRGQRSMVAWYFMFSICFLRASLSIPLSTVGSSVRPGRALAAYIRGRRARCCGTPTNWNKSRSIRIHARGVRDAPFWSFSFTFCCTRERCRRATLHNAVVAAATTCADDKWIQQMLLCLLSALEPAAFKQLLVFKKLYSHDVATIIKWQRKLIKKYYDNFRNKKLKAKHLII